MSPRITIAAPLLACAANVAPVTLEVVVRVESGGNPLVLDVNGLVGPQPHPATVAIDRAASAVDKVFLNIFRLLAFNGQCARGTRPQACAGHG